MELADDERVRIFDAAALALDFNAPLGTARAKRLASVVQEYQPATIVDLGCGTGTLARMVAEALPGSEVRGLDRNPVLIEAATNRSDSIGISFEVADATSWIGPDEAAICIGASHIFGGAAGMFDALARGVPRGIAVVGEGIWQKVPDPWCRDAFGQLPANSSELGTLAESYGWSVASAASSDLDEWDAFEREWCAGARSEGSEAARSFADHRAEEYERYRGVLGFCWLVLERVM
ncbi:MAG: class I SAM-dependent methyltransferase [Acidimicrobiales bacterium]